MGEITVPEFFKKVVNLIDCPSCGYENDVHLLATRFKCMGCGKTFCYTLTECVICPELKKPCIGEKCGMVKDGACLINPSIYKKYIELVNEKDG